jgi:hypothetical protein
MKKITIRNGRLRKSFTLVAEPYPKLGDEITIKRHGAKWFVSKIRDVGGFIVNVKQAECRAIPE